MPAIKNLENEIRKIILKSPIKTDLAHAEATKKWLLKLIT